MHTESNWHETRKLLDVLETDLGEVCSRACVHACVHACVLTVRAYGIGVKVLDSVRGGSILTA